MTDEATARVPLWIIERSARALPSAQRERYRLELAAELYVIPRNEQLPYALRVLSQTLALRTALRDLTPIGANTIDNPRTVPLSCRLHLWHHWVTSQTDDGDRYVACAKCGKEMPPASLSKNTIGA